MFDVFVITLAAVIGGFCVLRELSRIYGRPRSPSYPTLNTPVQPFIGAPGGYVSFQPTTLYHGTSLQNAFEIYNSGMWLVGNSQPPAVWMTDNFAVASSYIKGKGGIVVISVSPSIRLTNRGMGVFIYEIPYAQPWAEYYQIQCLKPIGVLDVNGNRLA